MSPKNIVIGQKVDPEKAGCAKKLRRNMTEAEQMLWQCLRANKLGGRHFRRQQVIGGYIVDFYCHSSSLAIELDGSVHSMQADYDAERDQVLQELGVSVLRIPNQVVLENMGMALSMILQACED